MAYAGFLRRVVAYLIDGVIFYAVFFIIGFILGAVLGGGQGVQTFVGLLSIVIAWLYFAMMESSDKQGTFGKMAIGIKVVDMSGRRISFGRATGRYFGKIVSGIILLIGYIMVAFTQKKQGLHDMMAGTLVVMK